MFMVSLASLLMPFNIYADSLPTSEIIGTSARLISVDVYENGTSLTHEYIYEITIKLRNSYVGNINGTLSYSMYDDNNILQNRSNNINRFVNGNEVKFSLLISQSNNRYVGTVNGPLVAVSFLLTSSNVTELSSIQDLQIIIDILNDLYNSNDTVEGLLANQLTQLQLVVQNTSLSNQYLETLTKMRQFNIPFESYMVQYPLLNQNLEVYNNINDYGFDFPLWIIPENTLLWRSTAGTNGVQIVYKFYSNLNATTTSILNYLSFENLSVVSLVRNNIGQTQQSFIALYTLTLNKVGNYSDSRIIFNSFYTTFYFSPIVADMGSLNYSTDFALRYGLNNKLLNDLNIIVNGTTQSNSANQQLDSNTSQFQTDSNALIDIEDTMSNNMDTAMQQITPSSNPGTSFGGNFLTSAVWVRTQFERLTNGNPFGSLIVYGLTLGLALLLLGKVFL